MAAPNAIAVKQALLEGFESLDQTGPRGQVRIGIMNVLSAFDQLPFWHMLLTELGYSVRVVHGKPDGSASAKGLDALPSMNVCYPAKQAHVRAQALLDEGATHVLMPLYDRVSRCAVNCEYAQVLKENTPAFLDGRATFVTPVMLARRISKAAQRPADKRAIHSAVRQLVPNSPVSQEEFDQAFDAAFALQQEFEDAVVFANEQAEKWARKPGNHGIVLAGRPYHADPALLHGLDREVAALGMSVLCGTHLDGPKPPLDDVDPWKPAKHLLKLAGRVANDPDLDLVCLQAFGCGYDSLTTPEVRIAQLAAGKAFTLLQLDDVMNNAQARVRLRTLAYVIKQGGRAAQEHTPSLKGVKPARAELLQLAQDQDPRAFNNLEKADVDAVFAGYPDLCFVAQALAGRACRLVAAAKQAERSLTEIAVPYVCKYCMLDALPRIVWRTTGCKIDVSWVDYVPEPKPDLAPKPAPPERQPGGAQSPSLGIVGVAPLVFDAYLNDNLQAFIYAHGGTPVMPSARYLLDEDMSYQAALLQLEQRGVGNVAYLNSFRCLKGHVDAYGAKARLQEQMPGLHLTIVDYDSEASVLNRQNRILLALQNEREKMNAPQKSPKEDL